MDSKFLNALLRYHILSEIYWHLLDDKRGFFIKNKHLILLKILDELATNTTIFVMNFSYIILFFNILETYIAYKCHSTTAQQLLIMIHIWAV